MKRIKSRMKSFNIFQLFISYACIIVLILSAMGIYSYSFLIKTVYADFLSGNEQYLSSIVSRHENDMQIVDNIVTQIGQMDKTVRFHLSEKPENSDELKKTLKGFTTVSQFFELVFYRYHEDPYFYHYLSSLSEKMLINHWIDFSKISTDEFIAMSTEKTLRMRVLPEQKISGKWIKSYLSDTRYVLLFKNILADLKDTLIFMVPGYYYDNLLADEKAERREDFLGFDGQIIVSRGNLNFPNEDLMDLVCEAEESLDKEQDSLLQREVFIGSDKYLFTVLCGESGIYYGTLQSMEVYHDKVMTEQWTIWMLIMICMLLAVTVTYFTSRGYISKVKKLNGLLNEENYYDLDKIESGIQTLVSTYRESEKERITLEKTRFIRNFIRGDFESYVEAIAEAEKAKLSISYNFYVVVLLRSREIVDDNKAYEDMLDVIRMKDSMEGYGIHLINNNQNLIVLYSDSKEMLEEVMQMMLKIGKSYSNDYVVACSDYHTDFSEGASAYLEAVNAFDNYLLLDNSKVIRFSEVSQKEYVSILPESYLQRLKQAIRGGDQNAAEITVKDICNKLNREKVSLYSFRIFYNDVIHILLSEWKDDKAQFNDFYNVFTLSQCQNLQEFGELLCEICNKIIVYNAGKTVSVSGIVENAIAYMKENYHNSELTMNALADYLDVSSVTLSVEFKNEMDIRPSDYLANLRMEKAKELLKAGDMKIREISLAVGYEDDRVFLRRFKKYTGMTPGEYRNS